MIPSPKNTEPINKYQIEKYADIICKKRFKEIAAYKQANISFEALKSQSYDKIL